MNNMGVYNYINVLDQAADAAWQRNEAISNNIANVDTPNYKRQEVDFESELKKAMGSGRIESNDTKVARLSGKNIEPMTYTDYSDYEYRMDGNNVDIEQENVSLAKNQIKYEALINSISEEFSNLRSVMR